MEKAYIVCLEKLTRTLNDDEKCIMKVLLLYLRHPSKSGFAKGPIDFDVPSDKIIKDVYKFVMFDDEEIIPQYSEDEIGIGIELKKEFRGKDISEEFFISFVTEVCKVYASGIKSGIPVNDIHGENMGYRGDELVAFDCM
jgi:hypothetical protein